MSQVSEFDANVRGELLAVHGNGLGWCSGCDAPVLIEQNFMRIDGRVAHVDCRAKAAGDQAAVSTRGTRARVARTKMAVECTLWRRIGTPIAAKTIDLGPDGMRVTSERPLSQDETVEFDLAGLEAEVLGRARVLRQQLPLVYVLRFERLPEAMSRRLRALSLDVRRRRLAMGARLPGGLDERLPRSVGFGVEVADTHPGLPAG